MRLIGQCATGWDPADKMEGIIGWDPVNKMDSQINETSEIACIRRSVNVKTSKDIRNRLSNGETD